MKLLAVLLIGLCLSSSAAFARAPAPVVPALVRAPVDGDAVRVLWGGQWWDGHVIDIRDDLFKVSYDGWDASWDEWVELERLAAARQPIDLYKVRVGDDVSVEWGGQWWDAHVLATRRGELFIAYDGYGDEWNEWVGVARLRTR